MQKNKILYSTLGIITILGIWYFVFRAHDYVISVEVPTYPSSLYYKILESEQLCFDCKNTTQLSATIPFRKIIHQIEIDNLPYRLEWTLAGENKKTKLSIGVIGLKNSLSNRWKVLIRDTSFEEKFVKKITSFLEDLKNYQNTFRIASDQKNANFPVTHFISDNMSCAVPKKAGLMMKSVLDVTKFLNEKNIILQGNPFSIIDDFDIEKNQINFRFCFPVPKDTKLPFGEKFSKDSLQITQSFDAQYFGNYATSNEAWLALIEEHTTPAKVDQYQFVESYLNNPHEGGDDTKWKALVYMIKK